MLIETIHMRITLITNVDNYFTYDHKNIIMV